MPVVPLCVQVRHQGSEVEHRPLILANDQIVSGYDGSAADLVAGAGFLIKLVSVAAGGRASEIARERLAAIASSYRPGREAADWSNAASTCGNARSSEVVWSTAPRSTSAASPPAARTCR